MNTPEATQEISLFNIPPEMITSRDRFYPDEDLDLDEYDNSVNPINNQVKPEIRALMSDNKDEIRDLEEFKEAIASGEISELGLTPEMADEEVKDSEEKIAKNEQRIAELSNKVRNKEKGTMKKIVNVALQTYGQTLAQRGNEPENVTLVGPVNVVPLMAVPGRYTITLSIKGLVGDPELRHDTMLILDTITNDINDKSPTRNRHFVLANKGNDVQLLASYQKLLENADLQKMSIKEYLQKNFQVEQEDPIEMWIAGAEVPAD